MEKQRTILLVDDHEAILVVLEGLLAEPSRRFVRAGCGEEALYVAREQRPDVVLLDVCMPGMDGLEVCDAIKNDPTLAQTRVILMSAIIGSDGLREGGDEVGADGYLGKPFNPDQVRAGVTAMLRREQVPRG